jgi:hypothetical protein
MENSFDPTRQIAIIWDIEDVKGLEPSLSDEEAFAVLQEVKRHHNPEYGVTWETLDITIDMLYPDKKRTGSIQNV